MLILACILKVRFFPSFFLLFMKETDIGRYVNGLRKHPLGRSQEAGEVAHQFERKWKEVMDGWVRLHNSVGDGGSSIAADGYSPEKIQSRSHQSPRCL